MADTPTNTPTDLEVELPLDLATGTYSNAFRVVEEAGPDCFLDFLVYSANEQRAKVVSRVRVRRAFIEAVRETLEDAQVDFQVKPVAPH